MALNLEQKQKFRNVARQAGILLAYLGLAVVFTWPLARHLSNFYPSLPGIFTGDGDPSVFLWYIDWAAKILKHASGLPAGQMLFYPNGFNALAGYDGLMVLLLGVPLFLLTGKLVLAYNLYIFLAIVLNCYAVYLLGRFLKFQQLAAFTGGFAFGLSAYVLVRSLQHPNLILLAPLPLLVLAGLRFAQRPGWRNAVGVAAAMLFCALSSWYYALSALVFLFILLLGHLNLVKRFWKELVLVGILVAAVLFAVAAPSIFGARGHSAARQPQSFYVDGSAQPLNFFVPHPFSVFSTVRIRDIYSHFPSTYAAGVPNPYEATSYFGVAGLLVLFYLIFHRRKKIIEKELLWLAMIAVFTLLALGPVLKISKLSIPLPFALLEKIYPYSLFRVPNRFFTMAFLAATVILMFTLDALKDLSGRRSQILLFILIAGLLAAERLFLPYPLVPFHASNFYYQQSAAKGNYAIADLPISYPGYPEYNLFQTVSGKAMVDGEYFYSAYDSETFSYIRANDLLAASVCSDSTGAILDRVQPRASAPDFAAQKRAALADLAAHNIKYVVVHNFLLVLDPGCHNSFAYVRAFFNGVRPVYADGEITVFATAQ